MDKNSLEKVKDLSLINIKNLREEEEKLKADLAAEGITYQRPALTNRLLVKNMLRVLELNKEIDKQKREEGG